MKSKICALALVLGLSACSHAPSTLPNSGSTQQVVPQVVQNGGTIPFRKFPVPDSGAQIGAVAIGNSKVWFVDYGANSVGYAGPSGGQVTEYSVPTANAGLGDITSGSDGNIWFTESNANKIGKVSQSGAFAEYAVPTANANPFGIVAGPDGALWFTEVSANKVGRIDTSGSITEYALPAGVTIPTFSTVGSDSNIWLCTGSGKIIRMTTGGSMTSFSTPSAECGRLTLGPDGRVYAAGFTFSPTFSAQVFAVTSAGVATTVENNWDCRNGLEAVERVIYCLEQQHTKFDFATVLGYDVVSHTQTVSVPIPNWFASPSVNIQGLTEAADGNLWFGLGSNIAVYERRLLTVSPTTVTVSVGQSQVVTASETDFNGALSAFSQNPSIASVSLQSPGTFKITGVSTGSTIVTVTDGHYNSFQVKVTVQ